MTALRSSATPRARLRGHAQDVLGIAVQQVGELVGALVGLGGRQVDLVQRGHDHEAGVARQVEVRKRLGLQALRGVDQQDRPLAGRQRPRHLVGEVDVAGRIDQVELEPLVLQPHGLGLDRDAPFALEVHLVEVLRPHVAALDRMGDLEHPVGQRRLAVVDMRHDAEVADVRGVGRHETPMVRGWGCPPAGEPARSAAGRLLGSYGEHQVPDQAQHPEREAAPAQQGREQLAQDHDEEGRRPRSRPATPRPRSPAQREAARALDKAASKGVIHKRTAARRRAAWPRPRTPSPRPPSPTPRPTAAIAAISTGITTSPVAPTSAPDRPRRPARGSRPAARGEKLRACCW